MSAKPSSDNAKNSSTKLVISAFLVPILAIAAFINSGSPKKADMGAEDAANDRIRPVASLELKSSSGPKVLQTGEEVYKSVCAACHGSGAAGAPKVGDAGAWSARLGQGYNGLLSSAIKGKNAMPARGGTSPEDVSDYELGRAIVHMVNSSGGKLAEPPAPPAAK